MKSLQRRDNKKIVGRKSRVPISATKAASCALLGALFFARGIYPVLSRDLTYLPLAPKKVQDVGDALKPPKIKAHDGLVSDDVETFRKPLALCPHFELSLERIQFLVEQPTEEWRSFAAGFVLSLLIPTIVNASTTVDFDSAMNIKAQVVTSWETAFKLLAFSPGNLADKFVAKMEGIRAATRRIPHANSNIGQRTLCNALDDQDKFGRAIINKYFSAEAAATYFEKLKTQLEAEAKAFVKELKEISERVTQANGSDKIFSAFFGSELLTPGQKDFLLKKADPTIADVLIKQSEGWRFAVGKGVQREFFSEDAIWEFWLPMAISYALGGIGALAMRGIPVLVSRSVKLSKAVGALKRGVETIKKLTKLNKLTDGKLGVAKAPGSGEYIVIEGKTLEFASNPFTGSSKMARGSKDLFKGKEGVIGTTIKMTNPTGGLMPTFESEIAASFLQGTFDETWVKILNAKPNLMSKIESMALSALTIGLQLKRDSVIDKLPDVLANLPL